MNTIGNHRARTKTRPGSRTAFRFACAVAALISVAAAPAGRAEFAHQDDFESDNGFITSFGGSWERGEPGDPALKPHSGQNLWATRLDGDYDPNEDSYLTSPEIDLSAYGSHEFVFAWWQILRTEAGYDYASIEASSDGGGTWVRTYGEVSGDHDGAWRRYKTRLGPEFAVANFRYRLRLRSDGSGQDTGFYVDDVVIKAIEIQNAYAEDFEAEKGGFLVAKAANGSWEWGVPLAGPGAAHSGQKAWGTDLDAFYGSTEDAFLNGPVIDLSGFPGKAFSISWWQHMVTQEHVDIARVEITKDGGENWITIRDHSGPVSTEWMNPVDYRDSVFAVGNFKIRYHFTSNPFVENSGVYVDDIIIGVVESVLPSVNEFTKTVLEDHVMPFVAADFIDQFVSPDDEEMLVSRVDRLPEHGSLDLDGQPIAVQQEITPDQLSLITYTPEPDYNNIDGIDRFDWKGADFFFYAPQTAPLFLDVIPVNDPPSFVPGADVTVHEDSPPYLGAAWATEISKGPANESDQTLEFLVETLSFPELLADEPTIDPVTGDLEFTVAPDLFGDTVIRVTLMDDGGTENGGWDTSASFDFTIHVLPVNDPPTYTPGSDQEVLEDAGPQSVLWATDISTGPPNESDQSIVGFLVDNDNPDLFSDPPAIDLNGQLTYTPADDYFGGATVTVRLMDDGGTERDGIDTSDPITLEIVVLPVNDAPSFSGGADVVVDEDSGAFLNAAWASDPNAGPFNEQDQSLHYEMRNLDRPELFSSPPVVATLSGDLSFIPAADAFGVATVDVVLVDDGGTDNGGVDESVVDQLTIEILPVNDQPSLALGPDITVLEDSGVFDQAGWLVEASVGPENESVQSASLIMDYLSAVNAIDRGLLRSNGSSFDGNTFTGRGDSRFYRGFVVFDLTSIQRPVQNLALQISVEVYAGADPSEAFEIFPFMGDPNLLAPDYHGESVAGQTVFAGLAHGTPYAAFAVSRSHVGSILSIPLSASAVADLNSANGDLIAFGLNAVSPSDQTVIWEGVRFTPNLSAAFVSQLVVDTPSMFDSPPTIQLGDGALRFSPSLNRHGKTTVFVTAMDDGGTDRGGIDRSESHAFTITIIPVNDPPTISLGADLSVPNTEGAVALPGWATDISTGPPDEAGQILSHTLDVGRPDLFAVPPVLNLNTGALTFEVLAGAEGVSTQTVSLFDDGGTENGGVDTTGPLTFDIEVTPNLEPEILSSPGLKAKVSVPYEYVFEATDPNLPFDELTLEVLDAPDWLSEMPGPIPNSLKLTGIPEDGDVGDHSVSLRVTDKAGLSVDQDFEIFVQFLRVTDGLIVLYEFDEGVGDTITDTSDSGTPLNLTIGDTGAVSWVDSGLSFDSVTIARTTGSGAKIADACVVTDEISIEVWAKPATTGLSGVFPVDRIVTMSQNIHNRNFTLGQNRDVFVQRLRTTTSSNNGLPDITIASIQGTPGLVHLVVTRASDGTLKVYQNTDVVLETVRSGSFANWNRNFAFGLGNEMTMDRGWLGELYLVAIYSRALTAAEVRENYEAEDALVLEVEANGQAGGPLNRQSESDRLTIDASYVIEAGCVLRWAADDGDEFRVEFRDGVQGEWQVTNDVIKPSNGRCVYIGQLDGARGGQARFYRIKRVTNRQ